MTKPLGLGAIGAGTITQRVLRHLALPDTTAVVRVAAIADPVPGRAAAVAGEHGGGTAYESVDDLLADPEVEAVTIASPINVHYAQGLAAIRAGKHVHFNKTMSVTTDEATHLIEEAARHNVRIVASPGEMLRPHNQQIRKLIADGALGRLTWAACGAALGNYHVAEPERADDSVRSPDPSWYYRKPGGGPLYDLTVYTLHGLTGILGPVRRIAAMSGVRIPEREYHGRPITVDADDNSVALLDFGDNLFAFVYGTAAGQLTDGVEFDFSGRYYGTKGSIVGLELNGQPFDYPGREIARSAPDGGLRSNFGGNEWLLPHITPAHRDLIEQHVFEDIMQLVDWVREGRPSIATAEHARHVIEIIEGLYRAAETGQTQRLQTTF
ncbi:Gfo/Idh/MocA family protein [Actinomadura madurae]|uniref:Gfo/Idh/MocA family protein n=1 Tax=Actinomadura madurae TaxID=1993 RepID=UPI000D8996DA|nr:Gfo/Idh/MocA family oxidoreductase [Actinomadura madurae]SPT51251.1 Uncharacterized oxidoreductase ycjS [Actinomadura madurae]